MTQKKKIIPRDKNIGNQLRKLRKKYRLSVEALADIANVDYKTIWNCENGYNSLTLDLLIKISPAFRDGNVDLASLFDFLVIQAIELETVNHYSQLGAIITVNTLFATITLSVDFEGDISTEGGLAKTTYNINNHKVDFTFDGPVQKVIEQNKLAFDPNSLLAQISAIGGKIEAGDITTTSNISAGDHVLTLQLKSTIEHKGQDNTTYDLGYAITLKIHMHKYNGSTVPVGVSATDVEKYNSNLDTIFKAAKDTAKFALSIENYRSTLLSSVLESLPKAPDPGTVIGYELDATIIFVGILALAIAA